MNLYEFYSSNKKVNITENLIHAKDVESEVITENLRKWFKEKWVRFGPDGKIRGECARGSESEGKPKCLPRSKAQSLGKKGRASAASKKRREDPNPERRGSAINVSTKVKESQDLTFQNVFENKARAMGTDSAARAQRDKLKAASVGATPGPVTQPQPPVPRSQIQSPVQRVDPAAAARAATRQTAATRVATSPTAPVSPAPTSTPVQQANLGIIDQGLSRLAGNLTKRDGKWYHPGNIPVSDPKLIKKAEASIARPPGTTASGTVRPAPTTGVSTVTPNALSGGADNDRTSSPSTGNLPLPPLPSLPTGPSTSSATPTKQAVDMGSSPRIPDLLAPTTDTGDETVRLLKQSPAPVTDTGDETDRLLKRAPVQTTPTDTQNRITIQRGDTLSRIARQSGTTVAELMRLNPQIKNADKIFAGDKINLPSFTGSAAAAEVEPKRPAKPATTSTVIPDQSDAETQRLARTGSQVTSQGTVFPSSPETTQKPSQQQELRSNLTPEQRAWAGNADLSRPETGSTGVIQRMPLPKPDEMADAIDKAESQKNPDIAFGDRVRNGQIVSTVKGNIKDSPGFGKPLLTAEQWSKQNLGDAKKLSDMTVDEVMRFQKYRSENHSNASAVGAYQFVGSTLENIAKKAGIDPKTTKFDQATQNRLLQELTKENASALKSNGIVPDKVNLYMAHAVGGRGALDIYDNLRQNPNKTVIDSLMDGWKSRNPNDSRDPAKVEAKRKQLLAGNPHFRDMKVGEYYNYLSGATRGDRRNTDYYRRTKISQVREEACPHCSGPMFNIDMLTEKKDACYYKVKSRYKVWPSAYASGALVKCRKRGASNWGKSKTNENLYFNVVGTDKKILINEFNMRHDVRGWYLTGDSSSSTKLDAFRAFGTPLTEEELNQAGYSGSAATIGVDNPVSPVGSLSKSQRINKKSRSK